MQKEKIAEIIKVRCDYDKEFENSEFKSFCEDHEITHQFSAPRTPQQNGVVERKNKTLVEMIRTMLCENRLPKYFWAEAVNTACYVTNRVLIRPILKKTPYELLNGKKLSVEHLRAFGCKCFILNNGKDHLEKFDSKADEGIFLGYDSNSASYGAFFSKGLMSARLVT